MIDAALTLTFIVFVIVCILILIAVAYLTLPIAAGLVILAAVLLCAAVLSIIRTPKRVFDHYAKPFGDYPKVPHGG